MAVEGWLAELVVEGLLAGGRGRSGRRLADGSWSWPTAAPEVAAEVGRRRSSEVAAGVDRQRSPEVVPKVGWQTS